MQKEFSLQEAAQQPDKIKNTLMYGSYSANRDYGMTHEQLLSIGIGNEEMKNLYDNEKHPQNEIK